MVVILKKDLKIIWNWLKTQITEKEREWLKEHRSGVWKEFSKDGLPTLDGETGFWQFQHADILYELSCRIQDILDAKRKRKEITYCFGEGFPKQYVVELAQFLGLEVSEKRPKYEILGKILQKIKEKQQEF